MEFARREGSGGQEQAKGWQGSEARERPRGEGPPKEGFRLLDRCLDCVKDIENQGHKNKEENDGEENWRAKGAANHSAGPGRSTEKDVQNVARLIKENNIQIVDLKFCDLPGLWQHFSIPASELTEIDSLATSIWEDGIGFDGSSIRGFQKINESDMILLPDPASAVVDPVCAVPTLSVICDIYDPVTKKPYTPRPPLHRQEGRGLPEDHRLCRPELLRPGAGVLHLRRHPLRPDRQHRLLLHRLGRGRMELGPRREAEPRLQAALQGRLLPGPAA